MTDDDDDVDACLTLNGCGTDEIDVDAVDDDDVLNG